MKSSMVVFLLLALMIPALAQQNFRPASPAKKSAEPKSTSLCSGETAHAHQYSDIRVTPVEIKDTDDCGFSYLDIEQNSVGLDQRFTFADDFVASHEESESGRKQVRLIEVPKDALKRGERGLAFYCSHCKTIFSLKL